MMMIERIPYKWRYIHKRVSMLPPAAVPGTERKYMLTDRRGDVVCVLEGKRLTQYAGYAFNGADCAPDFKSGLEWYGRHDAMVQLSEQYEDITREMADAAFNPWLYDDTISPKTCYLLLALLIAFLFAATLLCPFLLAEPYPQPVEIETIDGPKMAIEYYHYADAEGRSGVVYKVEGTDTWYSDVSSGLEVKMRAFDEKRKRPSSASLLPLATASPDKDKVVLSIGVIVSWFAGLFIGMLATRQKKIRNKDPKFGANEFYWKQWNPFNPYTRQFFTAHDNRDAATRAEANPED